MATPTNNSHIDSVLYGGDKWADGTFTYFFNDVDFSFNGNLIDVMPWLVAEKTAFRSAMKAWSDVANISFVEVYSAASADLVESIVNGDGMTDIGQPGAHAAHTYPQSSADTTTDYGFFNYLKYNYPGDDGYNAASLQPNGYAHFVYMHEIGHALGLAHPHSTTNGSVLMPGVSSSGDLGDYDLNQTIYTMMSYNAGWIGQNPVANGIITKGYNSGPGAFDIAAIQYLYGADTSNDGGNTTYILSGNMGWSSIWDTGGIDRIYYGGSKDAVINLNAATLDEGPNAGGFLTYLVGAGNYGGYTIAGDFTNALANQGAEVGVIIENATGGNGNDRIIGNGVANILNGRGGEDVILAGSGHDKVLGGSGADYGNGNAGNDILRGETGFDILRGGTGNDKMYGENGNDKLTGNQGNDTLNGGRGSDVLRGGSGADRFVFRDGWDNDWVKGFNVNSDKLAIDDDLWNGTKTAADIIADYAIDTGNNTVLDFGGGDKLTLQGVSDPNDLIGAILIV